jgi:hypothetical protein
VGSTGRAAKVGRYEPKRGDVATPGWNKGEHRVRVVWGGNQNGRTRVNGEMVSSNDETIDCCRVLDLAGGQEDEQRMREWVEGGCRQGTEVEVVSTMRRHERPKRMDDHRDFKCTGTHRERGREEENRRSGGWVPTSAGV